MKIRISPAVIVGLITCAIALVLSRGRSTPYNNFVLLAQAWLHGHSWIDWPGPYIDALGMGNQHYIIEAPTPAVLLLPFVAIFGLATNQTWLTIALCGITMGATWELGARLGVPAARNAWICAFMLAGTSLLWCAMLGDVWFLAHVSAVCFTMLALVELNGKRRGWLVALYASLAFESRFTFILAVPVYAYLLATGASGWRTPAQRWRQALIGFGGVLCGVAVLWVWYNFARWGSWYDIGYTAWYRQDDAGMSTGGPFKLMYFTYELSSFFVQAPAFIGSFPYIVPSVAGVALTWTSPALLLAFFAQRPLRWVAALWVMTVLCAAPNFIYYVDGYAQYGMRHALDFEPFLVMLMFLAARERLAWWWQVLIGYSVLAQSYGMYFWIAFVRK